MSIKTIRNLIDELREDKLMERIGDLLREGTGKCYQMRQVAKKGISQVTAA